MKDKSYKLTKEIYADIDEICKWAFKNSDIDTETYSKILRMCSKPQAKVYELHFMHHLN